MTLQQQYGVQGAPATNIHEEGLSALAKTRAYIKGVPQGSIPTGYESTPSMWELLMCIAQQTFLPRLFGVGTGEDGRLTLEGIMETLDNRDSSSVYCA